MKENEDDLKLYVSEEVRVAYLQAVKEAEKTEQHKRNLKEWQQKKFKRKRK